MRMKAALPPERLLTHEQQSGGTIGSPMGVVPLLGGMLEDVFSRRFCVSITVGGQTFNEKIEEKILGGLDVQ
jgi:hypothetical protein